jgi:hypothetical protein
LTLYVEQQCTAPGGFYAIMYIQGGPKVGIQYIVYKLLYNYFWPTLYFDIQIGFLAVGNIFQDDLQEVVRTCKYRDMTVRNASIILIMFSRQFAFALLCGRSAHRTSVRQCEVLGPSWSERQRGKYPCHFMVLHSLASSSTNWSISLY